MADTFLESVTDQYEIFLVLVGILGLILAFDRIMKEDEEESDILEFLGIIGGLVLFGVIILSIYNEEVVSKYTILFSVLFSLSLLAKAFKKLPIAFALTAVVALALVWWVLDKRNNDDSFVGDLDLKFLIVIIILILIVVFTISFIQEATMDIMLFILSWGLVILILAILVAVQGVTLLFDVPGENGLFGEFPGGKPN
ncbi:MAG: hypothetical protein HeimC2_04800 [Candidatus Heimdallarchaeota archaeon LC_2]|nr:MAG: hypothetical protein HeimC2_04800 [Candidatus Heimdallarchaeota archaeon LC_2]